jgi:hypothetical protein
MSAGLINVASRKAAFFLFEEPVYLLDELKQFLRILLDCGLLAKLVPAFSGLTPHSVSTEELHVDFPIRSSGEDGRIGGMILSNQRRYYVISGDIMPNKKRTALLIRCSVAEADKIRAAAKRDYRTISAYVLRSVRKRMELDALRIKSEERFARAALRGLE